jgi:hypothetical protein
VKYGVDMNLGEGGGGEVLVVFRFNDTNAYEYTDLFLGRLEW